MPLSQHQSLTMDHWRRGVEEEEDLTCDKPEKIWKIYAYKNSHKYHQGERVSSTGRDVCKKKKKRQNQFH